VAWLDALGARELRRTFLFIRAQDAPASASDVARALGVPRTAARWRLEKLAAAGLVLPNFEHRSGRRGPGSGRPAKTYAPAAETAQLEFPRRRYEMLLALLIRSLPRRARKAQLTEVGIAFGRELAQAAHVRPARKPRTGFERACRALGELGFHASLETLSRNEAVISSATCPLRPLVVGDAAAQAIDEGMWRGLVEASLDGPRASHVVCRAHDCLEGDGPCRIVVTFAEAD
jgi:predicted ArsR family transcriptional regulator